MDTYHRFTIACNILQSMRGKRKRNAISQRLVSLSERGQVSTGNRADDERVFERTA